MLSPKTSTAGIVPRHWPPPPGGDAVMDVDPLRRGGIGAQGRRRRGWRREDGRCRRCWCPGGRERRRRRRGFRLHPLDRLWLEHRPALRALRLLGGDRCVADGAHVPSEDAPSLPKPEVAAGLEREASTRVEPEIPAGIEPKVAVWVEGQVPVRLEFEQVRHRAPPTVLLGPRLTRRGSINLW